MLLQWCCLRQTARTMVKMRQQEHLKHASASPEPEKIDAIFEIESVRYVAVGGFHFELRNTRISEPSLVTVMTAQKGVPLTKTWVQGYLDRLEDCDVYRRQPFLAGLVITNVKPQQSIAGDTQLITSDFHEYITASGNQWIETRDDDTMAQLLRPGPYLIVNNTLKQVYRLYDDTQRAFLTAIRPRTDPWHQSNVQPQDTAVSPTGYEQLKAAGSIFDSLGVAVPARASTTISSLSKRRLRVAVKDCFFLQGLKNSLCNKAYYEISEPAPYTAHVVQILVRDGADILGLTKLSSMVAREEPMDAVDFATAFNPRGDGYQSPAGSSSGSAAAVASYDWLDCSLGTDTSGSGRRPAMVNGVWQFRPSHDLVSLDGLIKTYPLFDTPCVFARKLSVLRRVAEAWTVDGRPGIYPPSISPQESGYRIVYPLDYLPVDNPAQQALVDGFIDDMVAHLPATVSRFSIRDEWRNSKPSGTTADIDEYLANVVTRTYYHQFYHSSDSFRKAYSDAKDGRQPYVIPFVQRRWAKGAAVSDAEHAEATQRMQVYKKWLLKALFSDAAERTLVVLPVASAAPNYRDEPSPSPEEQSALEQLFVQPILGTPDIVIPIGEVPYNSRISGRVEYLPVVINILGAPKTDLALLDAVAKVMEGSRRATTVATGSRMLLTPRVEFSSSHKD